MKLKISNQAFDFWNDFTLTLKFDGVGSAFSFTGYFEPSNAQHKQLFRPLSFNQVEVLTDDDETLLTGVILNSVFTEEAKKKLVTISGYSLPGVLEDCPIPTSLYPLQSDNRSLNDIADHLIQPFGIKLVVDPEVTSEVNKIIKVSTAKESQSIKAYLTSIAAQKNIIISHTEKGELFFTRAKTQVTPVFVFDGAAPNVKITHKVNGQKMHSEITVQKQPDLENNNAGEETISNPLISSFRPNTKTQSSGTDIDTNLAARNALASELKGISVQIEMDRLQWTINNQKQIIKPNTIVSVQSDELYLYNKTSFFVEAVTLADDGVKETAVLTCVLPEVYNQNTPKDIYA